MDKLCSPAIVYLIFSISQILIDLYDGLFYEASVKFIVTVMVTVLLNMLCIKGLHQVAWLIVLIPFMFMIFIMIVTIYVFSNNDFSINYNKQPTYKPTAYINTYKPPTYTNAEKKIIVNKPASRPPYGSSSPEYYN